MAYVCQLDFLDFDNQQDSGVWWKKSELSFNFNTLQKNIVVSKASFKSKTYPPGD